MIYKLRLFSRDVVFEPLTLRASWMLQPNTLAPPTAQDLQPTRSLWVKQLGECIVNVASSIVDPDPSWICIQKLSGSKSVF